MFARFNRKVAAILSVATLSLLVPIAPATAQDGPIVVRGVARGANMVLVPYRDLNLVARPHQQILFSRVGDAVRHVCEFDSVAGPGTDYRTCSGYAWAGARPQMHRAFAQAYQRAYVRR